MMRCLLYPKSATYFLFLIFFSSLQGIPLSLEEMPEAREKRSEFVRIHIHKALYEAENFTQKVHYLANCLNALKRGVHEPVVCSWVDTVEGMSNVFEKQPEKLLLLFPLVYKATSCIDPASEKRQSIGKIIEKITPALSGYVLKEGELVRIHLAPSGHQMVLRSRGEGHELSLVSKDERVLPGVFALNKIERKEESLKNEVFIKPLWSMREGQATPCDAPLSVTFSLEAEQASPLLYGFSYTAEGISPNQKLEIIFSKVEKHSYDQEKEQFITNFLHEIDKQDGVDALPRALMAYDSFKSIWTDEQKDYFFTLWYAFCKKLSTASPKKCLLTARQGCAKLYSDPRCFMYKSRLSHLFSHLDPLLSAYALSSGQIVICKSLNSYKEGDKTAFFCQDASHQGYHVLLQEAAAGLPHLRLLASTPVLRYGSPLWCAPLHSDSSSVYTFCQHPENSPSVLYFESRPLQDVKEGLIPYSGSERGVLEAMNSPLLPEDLFYLALPSGDFIYFSYWKEKNKAAFFGKGEAACQFCFSPLTSEEVAALQTSFIERQLIELERLPLGQKIQILAGLAEKPCLHENNALSLLFWKNVKDIAMQKEQCDRMQLSLLYSFIKEMHNYWQTRGGEMRAPEFLALFENVKFYYYMKSIEAAKGKEKRDAYKELAPLMESGRVTAFYKVRFVELLQQALRKAMIKAEELGAITAKVAGNPNG